MPGKILDNFPGSSQSESNGAQTLGCLTPLQGSKTTQAYDLKLGFPITYKYSTSTTQRASCNGQDMSAVIGHSGQFNPLGGLIDTVATLTVAIVIAKIWRKIFGED